MGKFHVQYMISDTSFSGTFCQNRKAFDESYIGIILRNKVKPMQFEFVVILVFVVALVFGLWYWRSRTTTKVAGQTTVTESIITVDERLEQFRKDLFEAYASIHAKKYNRQYIPLESLKQKLSSKYTQKQFDELLAQARRKYPNNIWIDKDKNGKVMVEVIDFS